MQSRTVGWQEIQLKSQTLGTGTSGAVIRVIVQQLPLQATQRVRIAGAREHCAKARATVSWQPFSASNVPSTHKVSTPRGLPRPFCRFGVFPTSNCR